MRAKEVKQPLREMVDGKFKGFIAPEYPNFLCTRLILGGFELRTMVGGPEGKKITVEGKNRRTALSRLHSEVAKVLAAIL